MTISKTHHTLLLGAAALALDAVNAHGYCSRPAVTFPNGGDTTQFVATIESSASGLPGVFTGSPADNAAAFWTAFGSSKFSSIKDLATSLGQIVAKGATLECGLTDPNGTPQPIPDELEWSHSGTEGFTASHEGPCEAWCDDTQVFQDENCAAHFTTAPAKMPYDKAKCSGASRFTFYWLALHSSTWQVYVNCAALEGGSGDMYSTSQTEVNASESTEQSSPPTSSSDTPTAVVAPDQSYSFTGTTAAPSTTDVPVNTSKSTGESTTPAPSNATAPADVVPTSTPSPTGEPSFTFADTNAMPNTTEAVAPNTTKIIGSNTSETVAPSTPAPTDPSNTPSAPIATPTTEVISPTGDITTSSNSDVNSVGVVGIKDDCGSLDMAGEGDNVVKANTDISSSSNSGVGPDVNTVGVVETTATPNTTEAIAPNTTGAIAPNTSKIIGSNTSETVAPSTPAPTDPSNTPTATTTTPTTEVISPTGGITTSSNSGVGSDVNAVSVVGIEDDCGSLDMAGEGDNRVETSTVPVPDEDCGSFDIAGSEDMEDCGSLDIAGGSLDGVGSSGIDNRITSDSVGSFAGEVNPAISESSLNFDDVDRGYTGGKVQAPYQY
uniref:Uncharacterized protein n=1 Tax=Hyaloperonospora arabidopsidis (strain Emoy2) TaxID=559515 RepID=M4BZA0_HYAAE